MNRAHLAVHRVPGSGSDEELLARAGIDADHIAGAANRLLDRARVPAGPPSARASRFARPHYAPGLDWSAYAGVAGS